MEYLKGEKTVGHDSISLEAEGPCILKDSWVWSFHKNLCTTVQVKASYLRASGSTRILV
jgi:hypothetical protein